MQTQYLFLNTGTLMQVSSIIRQYLQRAFVWPLAFICGCYGPHALGAVEVNYFISDKSTAPLQIPQSAGSSHPGIVTEVIELLKVPELDIQYRVLPFKRMLFNMKISTQPWLSYGSDAWPSPQSISLSATPLLQVTHQLLTLSDTPYKGIEDLYGKTIILIMGFDYPGLEPYIADKKINATYVADHRAAIKSILSKRGVAFPEMSSRLQYHLGRLRVPQGEIALHDISDVIPDYDINLCFSRNFPSQARHTIEEQLEQLQHTGALQRTEAKYTHQ